MKKLITSILFILCLQINAQNIAKEIVSNNINRKYVIHLPTNFKTSNTYDLVFVLHGAMGTGSKLSKHSKFSKLSNENNFIAVYPNGMYKSWADARNVSKASKKNVDDVLFISDLINELKNNYAINKVYAAGISNGGFMVQTLACSISNKFTAFASIIASLPQNLEHKCKEKRNTPMLLMNGTKDRYVPFKGGKMPKFTKGGFILSTPKTINYWKNINETKRIPKIEKMPNIDATDGSKVVKHTYFKGDKAQVILYKIIGGGHGVPGNYTKRNPRFFKLGYVNQDINAEKEIWNFFKLH